MTADHCLHAYFLAPFFSKPTLAHSVHANTGCHAACSLARADAWDSSISPVASSSLLAGRCHSAAVWAAMKDCSPVVAPRNSKLRRRWLSPVWEVGNQLGRRETTGGHGLALVKIELEAKSAALLLGGEGCCTFPDPLPCGCRAACCSVFNAAGSEVPLHSATSGRVGPRGLCTLQTSEDGALCGRTYASAAAPACWLARAMAKSKAAGPPANAGR